MRVGLDVKKSEVHGMAQRGGCVTSHVRYGRSVHSPLPRKGMSEILLAFEKLEVLRYLDYLKPEGTVIINDTEIFPPSVNLGDAYYPVDIMSLLPLPRSSIKMVKAHEIGLQAGNPRAENTALLGVLSRFLAIDVSLWSRY